MRFKSIFKRVIKELLRDKRTLALMLFAPIVVLTLMKIVFDVNNKTHFKIGVDNTVPAVITEAFPSNEVEIKKYDSNLKKKEIILKDNLDAFITLDGSNFCIIYENKDPGNTAKVKILTTNVLTETKIQEMAAILQKNAMSIQSFKIDDYSIKNSYIYGNENSTFFDKIFPILICFFVFLFVFLTSGVTILKERTSKTLERLLSTPIKRSEIVMGYMVGYGVFAILQTLIIVFFSICVLKLHVTGDLGFVIATTILIALVALSIGISVSTFVTSEFQMVQFIPLIITPQVFFSGIIPLDTMSTWVRCVSYIFPLGYAGNALSNITIKGYGIENIWLDLGVLLFFILVFTTLNILGLKKYRKV
jgi:ABC-2 type transport system permease protein